MSINYDGFNGGQLEAIKHGVGPAVVAAPAGSGKTACFVNRIARILFEEGVYPSQVLGVTFTKAAADNMKERLQKLVPTEWSSDLSISTIHSLCWAVVRDADPRLAQQMKTINSFLIPGFAVRNILEKFIQNFSSRLGADPRNIKSSSLKGAIGLAKNYHVKPLGSREFFSQRGFSPAEFYEEAYRYYERERLDYFDRKQPGVTGRYDQDDMLVLAADYLASDEALRKKWGGKFKFILVDEVQDTSPIQFEIVELLMKGGGHKNVMLVGDLRQSIYGFRGAFPQYIQTFTDTHDARVINLNFNYRSRPQIVEIANRVARRMHDIDERFRSDMIAGKA